MRFLYIYLRYCSTWTIVTFCHRSIRRESSGCEFSPCQGSGTVDKVQWPIWALNVTTYGIPIPLRSMLGELPLLSPVSDSCLSLHHGAHHSLNVS